MNETYMVDDTDALDGNYTDDDTMAISQDHFENEHKEHEHDTTRMDTDMDIDTDMDMKESGVSNRFCKIGASITAGAFIAAVGL